MARRRQAREAKKARRNSFIGIVPKTEKKAPTYNLPSSWRSTAIKKKAKPLSNQSPRPIQPLRNQQHLPSKKGAQYVYYFGSSRNIAGILRWGQMAHIYAKKLPDIREISDTEVMEKRQRWWKHCCLYFSTHTATQKTQKGVKPNELIFIRYRADEMFKKKNAQFSDGNLANNLTNKYCALSESQSLDKLHWEKILDRKKVTDKYWMIKKAAEMMIPHYIKPEAIHSIIVHNEEMKETLIDEFHNEKWDQWDRDYRKVLKEIKINSKGDEVEIASGPSSEMPKIEVSRIPYF